MENEEHTKHEPDFIYVEPDHHQEREEYFESIRNLEKAKYPFFMRIFTFVVSIFTFFTLVAFLLITSLFGILSVFSLFKAPFLTTKTETFLKGSKMMFVFSLGLLIATFNPPFGFGIIVLYFMLIGEDMNKHMMTRVMKDRF